MYFQVHYLYKIDGLLEIQSQKDFNKLLKNSR